MNLLFVGDVVGSPGRNYLREMLPGIIEAHDVDFTIINGENAAGGAGLTKDTARELFSAGADVITSGNHIWDKKRSIPQWTKIRESSGPLTTRLEFRDEVQECTSQITAPPSEL